MRQTLTVAVGSSLVGASLPDGSGATAVQVDNPSGGWLDVYPVGSTVPPYTQGFVIAFVAPTIVDVRYLPVGPAGQVSTLVGDPVTVTLFDAAEAPPASTGGPFITGTTPPLAFVLSQLFSTSTPVPQIIIPAVAGKRIRILSIDLWTPLDSGVVINLYGASSLTGPQLIIGQRWDRPSSSRYYPNGFDFLTGDPLHLLVRPIFIDTNVNLTIGYVIL